MHSTTETDYTLRSHQAGRSWHDRDLEERKGIRVCVVVFWCAPLDLLYVFPAALLFVVLSSHRPFLQSTSPASRLTHTQL